MTADQERVCRLVGLNPGQGRFVGQGRPVAGQQTAHVVVAHPAAGGDVPMFAIVSEHGSVTYCQEPMLAAHLRGIPAVGAENAEWLARELVK